MKLVIIETRLVTPNKLFTENEDGERPDTHCFRNLIVKHITFLFQDCPTSDLIRTSEETWLNIFFFFGVGGGGCYHLYLLLI